MNKSILLSWSTGKDSAWTLHRLRAEGAGEIVGLMTTTTGEDDQGRVSIHGVGLATLAAQAGATGLPVRTVHLPDPCSNADYESAMENFLAAARTDGVTHVAFGDLFLEDVRRYREDRLAGSGIEPLFPLWGLDTAELAREMIAAGLRARVVSVDTAQLDGGFLGRAFDEGLLRDLPAHVDPCGERGEFHTFCHAGPMFAAALPVRLGRQRRHGQFAHIEPIAESASI